MKFRIGKFVLDSQARTLNDGSHSHKIRPRTLDLLLYLIRHPDHIVSKDELLTNVWAGVTVDEGVVFQSVREIRQLFGDADAVLNHPRKGYTFELEACEYKTQAPFYLRPRILFAAFTLCVALLLALVFPGSWSEAPHDQQRILVLPVKNKVTYGQHEWVYLGAMEQLVSRLNTLSSEHIVFPTREVIRLMHLAELQRDYDTAAIGNMFNLSGASLIVETELYGNASDYKLVYKLHRPDNVKQGVILDPSVADAVSAVSTEIADEFNLALAPAPALAPALAPATTSYEPSEEFSDALFAQAMISYESDWKTSVSFFESYLALNPESVIAHIYLSKLYLWQNEIEEAIRVLAKADKLVIAYPHDQAHIKLVQARVASKKQDWPTADTLFQQAREIIEPHNRWFLKASIAEEYGLALLEQKEVEKGISALEEALTFYEITRSPIGVNSTRLHLSHALLSSGQTERGAALFELARNDIQATELEFLYTMLADYEKRFVE